MESPSLVLLFKYFLISIRGGLICCSIYLLADNIYKCLRTDVWQSCSSEVSQIDIILCRFLTNAAYGKNFRIGFSSI